MWYGWVVLLLYEVDEVGIVDFGLVEVFYVCGNWIGNYGKYLLFFVRCCGND